jgi:hypothetical protein
LPAIAPAEFLATVAQPLAQHPAILYFDPDDLSAEGLQAQARRQPPQRLRSACWI